MGGGGSTNQQTGVIRGLPSNTGLPTNSQGYRFAKSFYKTAPNCILVGTQVAIYYSTNNGESWSFKNTGLTNKEINRIVKDESGIFYAGTDMSNGVYYSTNGGDYWYHLGLNLTTYTIGWDSESRLYAGGSSQGLYRFVIEDSTWIQVYNQGYNPVEVDDLCLTRSGYLFTITHWDGLQWSSNNGESWTRINFPGVNPYAIETIDDSIFIAGKGNIYVSNNYGNAWFIPADFGILGKNSLQYDSATQILYAGSESFANEICGIYTSTDSGQNWELLSTLPMTATRKWVTALWVTRTNKIILANVIYAWPQSQYSRFFKSSDNGQSWEIISEGNVVHQIVEDASSVLYATSSNGLMVSEDEGKTWTTKSISGSWCLATDYSGRIYHDLTCSTDKGNTWFDLPISGFNAWFNEDLAISHSNRIYAASTEGIFYGEADSIVVSVEKNEPIKTFNLCQNYPNPFNPTTSLQYAIGSRQFVTLKVYDLLGREVATLVNEEKPAGEYEVEFNAANLSSGIYFYQLQAGEFISTKEDDPTSLKLRRTVLLR